MTARKHQFKNPAVNEPAEITGDFESFQPGTRELMAADPVFLGDRVGRRHFDFRLGVHEGGHTVASYIVLSCAGSSIEYIDGHFGLTWSDDTALEPNTESVESICLRLKPLMIGALHSEIEQAHSHCIEFLAGVVAEELFCDELLPNTAHDIEAARAVAGLIVRGGDDSAVDSYLDLARTETRALLSTHAASVLAVADALIKRRTLSGTDIDSIIGSAFG
jgi:hypothetical protein